MSNIKYKKSLGCSIVLNGLVAGDKEAQFAIDMFQNNSMSIVMRFNPRFGSKLIVRNAHREDGRLYIVTIHADNL